MAKKKEKLATTKMNKSLDNLQYSCGYKERPDEKGATMPKQSARKGPEVRTSSQLGKSP